MERKGNVERKNVTDTTCKKKKKEKREREKSINHALHLIIYT